MGVQERKIEMLFLHPAYIRKGLGRMLVERAFRELQVEYVDVNEQNPGAAKFYGLMGFKTFKRNEYDSEGNPRVCIFCKIVTNAVVLFVRPLGVQPYLCRNSNGIIL